MDATTYDLIVIGSGPAGQKAAFNAAKMRKRVALVERNVDLGGVCIHTGNDSLQGNARSRPASHRPQRTPVYGAELPSSRTSPCQDLLYRCQHVVRTEVEVIRNQMHRNGVTVINGSAPRSSTRTPSALSTARSTEIHGHHILVAVGTVPARPADCAVYAGRSSTATNF
jgi:NAD(P) transhydrogenase